MNNLYRLLLCCLLPAAARAQTAADFAVQLSATVQQAPPQIQLQWKPVTGDTSYTIFRKAKQAQSWGPAIATLGSNDSSYTDLNVVVDSAYEYKVQAGGSQLATGYIYAGIRERAIHNRGRILLVVDSSFTDSCQAGIAHLMHDLRGDGWAVGRIDVSRTIKDTSLKALIRAQYLADTSTNALLLLGHLPVPYSGFITPDGHADHKGAWPADVYYADMDGMWTDNTVNATQASRPENVNIPGDGKWDQSSIPSPLELQVSRVDFHSMPGFGRTEVQLMNAYLGRLHLYKSGALDISRRALIDDNFGAFGGEAFAANGWRNYPVLVGRSQILQADLITTLQDSSYQWAYGCGGGYFTGAGGLGSTPNIAAGSMHAVFVQLFGSYFGDWDNQDNFLRAPLCADTPALACFWAGRPNWFLHHMALGETVGYAAAFSQNGSGLYSPTNFGSGFVHVALMGDLSLRTNYLRPASGFTLVQSSDSTLTASWTASPDTAVIGYYVYRSSAPFGHYQRVSGLLATTSFADTGLPTGYYYYMVRPVKPESTPSGGYYNPGIGIVDSISFINTTAVPEAADAPGLSVYPNPAGEVLYARLEVSEGEQVTLNIYDAGGRLMSSREHRLTAGVNTIAIGTGGLAPGVYTISLSSETGKLSRKWVKE